jgi:3-oxoacyl-[acyl-carrier protein] reductase
MVRNLAPELAERNIAINAIAPGATATRMATRYSANYTHLHLLASASWELA